MPSKTKPAISFRELREELLKLSEELPFLRWEDAAFAVSQLAHRINTEAITYGPAKSLPGADDAHKMPHREYWRYEFAGRAMQGVLSNDALLQRLEDSGAERFCITWAERVLEALQENVE